MLSVVSQRSRPAPPCTASSLLPYVLIAKHPTYPKKKPQAHPRRHPRQRARTLQLHERRLLGRDPADLVPGNQAVPLLRSALPALGEGERPRPGLGVAGRAAARPVRRHVHAHGRPGGHEPPVRRWSRRHGWVWRGVHARRRDSARGWVAYCGCGRGVGVCWSGEGAFFFFFSPLLFFLLAGIVGEIAG